MSKVEQAVATFKEGFNCAQAILATYGPALGIGRDQALKLCTGLGSGMGRAGLTCGAVAGAVMAAGLAHGITSADDKAGKERTYALAAEIVESFVARNDTIVCKELIGCDLSKPGGLDYAKEHDLFDKLCTGYVRDAAEILEDLLPMK